MRDAWAYQRQFPVDHQRTGGQVAEPLEVRMLQATDRAQEITEGQHVDKTQQVADQRCRPANGRAVILYHAQPHDLLAWRAALVEHFEQHHVPPAHQEQQQRTQPDPHIAEQRQRHQQDTHDDPAHAQVECKGQCPGGQASRAQGQVDALRRFYLIVGIQRR